MLTYPQPPSRVEEARQMESDSVLVCRAKQEAHAFAPLYERYRDDILHYCFRCLRDWEDAAEVAQQTFANALGGLTSFQDRNDSFRPWLFRIARNEVMNRHRQRAFLGERVLHEADWIMDPGHTPEEFAIRADESATTQALLRRLTPAQRQCCALRFSGLSHRETAARLGKSEVAVRASYSRGVATLRALLEDPETRLLG